MEDKLDWSPLRDKRPLQNGQPLNGTFIPAGDVVLVGNHSTIPLHPELLLTAAFTTSSLFGSR